jgi:hypothetical protein
LSSIKEAIASIAAPASEPRPTGDHGGPAGDDSRTFCQNLASQQPKASAGGASGICESDSSLRRVIAKSPT